jgi:hypothetical protein
MSIRDRAKADRGIENGARLMYASECDMVTAMVGRYRCPLNRGYSSIDERDSRSR